MLYDTKLVSFLLEDYLVRLNKLTDYSVLIMIPLAQAWPEGHVMSARSLSEVANIPLPTVSKLLKVLAHAKLVTSTRGITGGYKLAGSPADISVADILEAVEGPVALTDCVTGQDGECAVQSMCWMKGRWDAVNQAVSSALGDVSLLDMMPAPFSFEPSFEERVAARSSD